MVVCDGGEEERGGRSGGRGEEVVVEAEMEWRWCRLAADMFIIYPGGAAHSTAL